ncbi:MAG: response regulator [Kouleothrix sp.]
MEILGETRYDLVFTDLQMPEMGGIELLQQMRQRYPEPMRLYSLRMPR